MRRALTLTVGVVAAIVSLSVAGGPVDGATPTFTCDVAPIIFKNCSSCHRPGEIGPMSLLSYRDVRPWSAAIKQVVQTGEMPPWPADPAYGHFRNERRLSKQEVDTLVAWVDAGAPRGDGEEPAPPEFAEGWSHPEGRPPDYVLEMPFEFEIPDIPALDYQFVYQPVPFSEDKFVEAIEMRPGNRAVVHHMSVHVTTLPPGLRVENGRAVDEEGRVVNRRLRASSRDSSVFDDPLPGSTFLVFYVPGNGFNQFRDGVAKRITAGKYIMWDIHYQPTGKPEKDRSRVGFWFGRTPATHEVLTKWIGGSLPTDPNAKQRYFVGGKPVPVENGKLQIPNIPPHADNWEIVGVTPVNEPITIYSLTPHMHVRGKDKRFVVIWPDGREETILYVPKYDFNWQVEFELVQPLKLPAGSVLKCVAHYDNTAKNPYNPAPDKEVIWGDQSWDEMFQGYIKYSIDSQVLKPKATSSGQR